VVDQVEEGEAVTREAGEVEPILSTDYKLIVYHDVML
jgi:hypothetical protein